MYEKYEKTATSNCKFIVNSLGKRCLGLKGHWQGDEMKSDA